jgi:hypothetical protein
MRGNRRVERADRARPERRSGRRRRGVLFSIILIAGAGLAVAGLSVTDAFAVRADLTQARASLSRIRAAVADLNIADATLALNSAAPAVERAWRRAHSLSLRMLARVPIAGRTARSLQAITDAARLAIAAGRQDLLAASDRPGAVAGRERELRQSRRAAG